MKRYGPAIYFLGSLLAVLLSNWALKPMTMISYFVWIAFGPMTLAGFASLGGWSWKSAAFVAAIYGPATLALALCYWIGLRGTPIARWTRRIGIAAIWLMCSGFNLWVVGHST
jgi:hypothetical protein